MPRRLDLLATPEMMERLIRRECARAERSGGEFSLVLFRVPRGSKPKARAACRVARVMLGRARLTDEVGWLDGRHLAALLPDTTPAGATAFAEGVQHLLAGRAPKPISKIYSYPESWVPSAARDGASAPIRIASGHTPRLNGNANGHAPADNALADSHAIHNGNGRHDARHNGGGMRLRLTAPSAPVLSRALLEDCEQPGLPIEAVDDLLVYPMPRWKRALDVIGAAVLLALFAPLMAVAAAAIRLSSPGPAVFAQRRAGLGGRPFTIYKFRTMVTDAEARKKDLRRFSEQDGPAFKLTRDPRITRVGHLLRKTSIDELPQLWNVLKGDMSLVGPRPLPLDESDACEPWQRRRLDVTPGLTCIWQIKGRSRVTFAEWVRMDVEYIRRRTVWHDLSILFKTVPAVLLRRGAR